MAQQNAAENEVCVRSFSAIKIEKGTLLVLNLSADFFFILLDETGVSAVQFGNSSTSVLATLAALAEASAPLSNSSETPG